MGPLTMDQTTTRNVIVERSIKKYGHIVLFPFALWIFKCLQAHCVDGVAHSEFQRSSEKDGVLYLPHARWQRGSEEL